MSKLTTACFLFALVALAGPGLGSAAEPPRPNILVIVADDLGWGDVGWHGGFGKTPTMDRLVREGVELDRHYVQPVCTPTRTALMTGRYPGRFGPQAIHPSNLRALPRGTVTLASALKSLGYATFQAGKWHLGSRPEWGPNAYGFDQSYGTLTGAADPWTHKYRSGPYEDTWHRDGVRLDEEGNATELVTVEAERRIREGGVPAAAGDRKPWFSLRPLSCGPYAGRRAGRVQAAVRRRPLRRRPRQARLAAALGRDDFAARRVDRSARHSARRNGPAPRHAHRVHE